MSQSELESLLARKTVTSDLFKTIPNKPDRLECLACAHRCKIKEGKSGICNIRFNDNGTLKVPFNYVAGFQVDPIEKKPFFHAYPQSHALSFGMLGCDLHCGYCQNWVTSQAVREDRLGVRFREITAEELIAYGTKLQARVVVSTYNEPLITSEWAVEVFKEGKNKGMATGFVSNGNATPEVLDYIRPYTELYKIDLKTFNDKNYRKLGVSLEKILQGVKEVYKRGFWMEIVTLLVPGFNDSPDEIRQMAEFLFDIDPNIPWHITAFHQDYKMTENPNTTANDLFTAGKIGKEVGMNYVYLGNLPGRLDSWENTKCPNCNSSLVERRGFHILNYTITDDGNCPECTTSIPGIWELPTKRDSLFYFFR